MTKSDPTGKIDGASGFRLECGACGTDNGFERLATLCPECGGPQLVRYTGLSEPGPELARRWADRPRGMWRFTEILPLRPGEDPVSLGEGDTPLLPLPDIGEEFGLRLLVKDEGRNPTGSFKDRGLSAAVTRAVHDGVEEFVDARSFVAVEELAEVVVELARHRAGWAGDQQGFAVRP